MIRFLQTEGLAKKIIFLLVIGSACIAMVITFIPGINAPSSVSTSGIYATVAGTDVTVQQINDEASRIGRQQFRGAVPEGLRGFLRVRAAQQLVVRQALVAEARRMGLRVTPEELRASLQTGALGQQLFPGGQFIGEDNYEQFVQDQFSLSVVDFENMVKDDLLISKLLSTVTDGVQVPLSDLQQAYTTQNTKVKFDYAVLTQDDVMKQVKITDAEGKDYFEKHKQQYANAIPEKRKLAYAVIDTASLPVQVSAADIESYYKVYQDEYRVPESVDVRHILIKTPPPGPDGKVDPAAVAAARAKAEDILKQLRAGADFTEMAKKYSEDPGSAKNGGLYQGVVKGQMVQQFEQAAFSLPVGKLSDLVQTDYGFHILKVDKHTPAHLQTLDEVRAKIEPLVKRQKEVAAAQSLIDAIQSQAGKSGLEKAAAAKGLKVITTDFVTRADSLPGVGIAPDLMTAAFQLQPKAPPQLVKVPDGYALVEVLAVEPPAPPTFEAVKDQVERDLKNQKASELLAKEVQQLADRARAEHDLKKAAKEVGAKVLTSDLVGPSSQVPELGSMSGDAGAVFGLQPGQIAGPLRTATGGAVVYLLDKQQPPMADFDQQKEQLRESVLATKRQEVQGLFLSQLVDSMEKNGKIRYNPQEKKALEEQARTGLPAGE